MGEDNGMYDTILYVSKVRIEEVSKDDVIALCSPDDLGKDAVLVPTDITGAGAEFPKTCDPEEILVKLSPKEAVEGMIKALAHFETSKKDFKESERPLEMTVKDMDDYEEPGAGGEEDAEEEEQEESEEEDAEEDEDDEPKSKKAKKA